MAKTQYATAVEKPFRYYYQKPGDRGVTRPLLVVGAEWDQEVPNTNGSRIETEAVTSIMNEIGLGSLTGIAASMAWNLQLMKESAHFSDVQGKDAQNPVMSLRRSMPELIDAAKAASVSLQNALAIQGCPERERRNELLQALGMFIDSSDKILGLTWDTGGGKSSAHWHDDAYFLAVEIFEEAKRNGTRVALSHHDSAGVILIGRLLDELEKVNHSGLDAIAKELNRKRKSEPFLSN